VRHFSLFIGVLVTVGWLAEARPAAADIPPAGICNPSEVGQACDDAVDESGNDVGAGVCVADECHRATPDGPMTYDCVMCRPPAADGGAGGVANDPVEPAAGNGGEPSAGRAGSSSTGKAGSSSAGTPNSSTGGSSASAGTSSQPSKKPEADSGGCSLGSNARSGSFAGLTSLLILGVALLHRRSRPKAG
jgi:MYXO-CTERM domain-containing protein